MVHMFFNEPREDDDIVQIFEHEAAFDNWQYNVHGVVICGRGVLQTKLHSMKSVQSMVRGESRFVFDSVFNFDLPLLITPV